MAHIKYFADQDSETIEFSRVDHRGGSGPQGGSWGWSAERSAWVKITRTINYKAFPSRHVCDARCMNASGRTMNCECSCGGKNHGRGNFVAA